MYCTPFPREPSYPTVVTGGKDESGLRLRYMSIYVGLLLFSNLYQTFIFPN